MRQGRFAIGSPGMNEGWGRSVAGAVAALGGLGLGVLLIYLGALLALYGDGWALILAGAACWVAALLIVARRFSASAGAFGLAGVLVLSLALSGLGIIGLVLALACWLLALVAPWWAAD